MSSLLNPNNRLNFGLTNILNFSINNSLKCSPKFRLKNRLQFRPKFSLKFGGQNNICTHYIRTIYYNTILLYYIKQYKKIIYITIYTILYIFYSSNNICRIYIVYFLFFLKKVLTNENKCDIIMIDKPNKKRMER